jgi:hypothetical protein
MGILSIEATAGLRHGGQAFVFGRPPGRATFAEDDSLFFAALQGEKN